LHVLVRALPPESATVTALRQVTEFESDVERDPEAEQWSRVEHLLAGVIDAVHQHSWIYVSAHSDRAPDRPPPLPRPGVAPKKTRLTITQAELLFDAIYTEEG
jgi:hypothetical protein